MYARWLFVLLAALNLGAAGWLLFAGTPQRALPPATDPGVPELQLVAAPAASGPAAAAGSARTPAAPPRPPGLAGSAGAATTLPAAHRPVEAATAAGTRSAPPATAALPKSSAQVATASAAAGVAPPAVAPEVCTAIGPFATGADARAAEAALSPHVMRIRLRTLEARRPRGYWVYLPAAATHERALAETRALAAKGIKDYYVINAGDAENAISLGVYNDPVNAQNRVDQVAKLGFAPKVRPRADTAPAQWLDFAVAAGTQFPWRQWVTRDAGLTAESIACF